MPHMYHLPGNVISATVGLDCINLQPEYETFTHNFILVGYRRDFHLQRSTFNFSYFIVPLFFIIYCV